MHDEENSIKITSTLATTNQSSTETDFKTNEGIPHSLEHDHLLIGNVKVPFLVSKGRVFFDQLAAFTVLGQLRLPLMNDWDLCDKILSEQGLSQKDAFFRQTRTGSGMPSSNYSIAGNAVEKKRPPSHITHQSHITFKAIRVLTEHGLVKDVTRKNALVELFKHLQNEINKVFQCRKEIIEQIQASMNISYNQGINSDMF